MADPRCTETMATFAMLGVGMSIAIVLGFVYGSWVLYFRPLIADWRDGRKRR